MTKKNIVEVLYLPVLLESLNVCLLWYSICLFTMFLCAKKDHLFMWCKYSCLSWHVCVCIIASKLYLYLFFKYLHCIRCRRVYNNWNIMCTQNMDRMNLLLILSLLLLHLLLPFSQIKLITFIYDIIYARMSKNWTFSCVCGVKGRMGWEEKRHCCMMKYYVILVIKFYCKVYVSDKFYRHFENVCVCLLSYV